MLVSYFVLVLFFVSFSLVFLLLAVSAKLVVAEKEPFGLVNRKQEEEEYKIQMVAAVAAAVDSRVKKFI